MKRLLSGPLLGVCALALAASVAACGGGGGGGGSTPPTGGGGSSGGGSTPTPAPQSTPGAAAGALAINNVALANAKVTFTCGCVNEAGLTTTNSSGQYTIQQGDPAAPNGTGTYTYAGHNVLVIGYAPTTSTQAWTMDYASTTSTTNNLNLGASDAPAAAAALYLYYEVKNNQTIAGSGDQTFDWFNYNTISAWTTHLRTAPDATETTLLNDINSAQAAGTSLFPYDPSWNPTADSANPKISADLSALSTDTADTSIPTPCPSINGCTGAPTP